MGGSPVLPLLPSETLRGIPAFKCGVEFAELAFDGEEEEEEDRLVEVGLVAEAMLRR